MGRINVTYSIFVAPRCQQFKIVGELLVSRLLDPDLSVGPRTLQVSASTLLAQDHCFSDSTRAHAKVRAPKLP